MSRLGCFTAYLANVFLTKLQDQILPMKSRDLTQEMVSIRQLQGSIYFTRRYLQDKSKVSRTLT